MKKVLPSKRSENVRHALRDIVPLAQEVEKTGKKIYWLNIGDPMVFDYRTPANLWKAIFKNKKQAEGYSNALGHDVARNAVAKEAERNTGKKFSKEDCITFVGGSEAIIFALQGLMNKGDNLLTPCPTYSIYTGELSFLECPINEYYLNEEDKWQPELEDLEKKINKKTRGILIINPNNPTGAVYSKKTLKEIINIAAQYELPILSDETYDKLVFDNAKMYPLASLSDEVPMLIFGSISKNYLCPGFRGGWIYKHDPQGMLTDYFEAIKKFSRLRLSTVAPVQFAIAEALNGTQEHLHGLIKKLQKRRDICWKRLNELEGISCVKPKAAFYAYPRIDLPIKSDKEFCLNLLKETGVCTVYGSGFGQKPGTKHFRIVFLPSPQILNEAFDKIEEFIKKHYSK